MKVEPTEVKMNFKYNKLLVLGFITFVVVILTTGCAFGTREIKLKNTDTGKTSPSSKRNHEICFDELSDFRPDSTIGHVQNGYGMRTAEVKSINQVPDWINEEIKLSLD